MSETREHSSLAPTLMRDGLVPGLQLATIRNGRVVGLQSHGVANAASGQPVTDRTIFEAASLGKPVFAYGVLRLASSGRLDLDAPIGRTLPDLSPAMAALTSRQLLSHTAGLPNQGGGKSLTPEGRPGERFSYSGEGYRLLQRVVERISGRPLNDYMQEQVFGPLGMTSSSFVWRDEYRDFKAFGHRQTGASAGRTRLSEARAPSSLETNAADYARFLIASIRGTGLDPLLARQFLTRQVGVETGCVGCLGRPPGPAQPGISWGLGWALAETSGGRFAWHWGDNETMQAYAAIALDGSRGMVAFTNSANGHSVVPLLVERTLGIDAPGYSWVASYERFDAPRRSLLRRIVRDGAGALSPSDHAMPMADLVTVARWLADGDRPAEAAALLGRVADREGFGAAEHALLAEAYRRAGRPSEAAVSARAALRLDPASRSAKQVLERLDMSARTVAAERLSHYAGRYMSPFGPLEVTTDGRRLLAQLEDQPAELLLPASDTRFVMDRTGLPLEFVYTGQRVAHAVVEAGEPIRLPRID